jgi:hypothetical protein
MIYDQVTKLFSDGNCQIVLSGNQQIYMVDLAGQKYISKYIIFFMPAFPPGGSHKGFQCLALWR